MVGDGPIVFLDVDGVLVCSRSLLSDYDDKDGTLVHDPLSVQFPLERRCLSQLRRVLEATKAKIVISSTWRLEPCMRSFLLHGLKVSGIAWERIAGDTPVVRGGTRGQEICAWLAAASRAKTPTKPEPVESVVGASDDGGRHSEGGDKPEAANKVRFAILDDQHAEGFKEAGLLGSFVQTNLRNEKNPEQEGLTASLADRVIRLLTE